MGQRVRFWVLSVGLIAVLFGETAVGLGGSLAAPAESKGKQSGAQCPTGAAQVVLDPGHGGTDPGAVYGSLVEKELNLQVALVAEALLNDEYTVALTRYDNGTTLGTSERGEIANACGAEIFVSIHFNASTDTTVNSTQTFWGKRRKDEAFAQHMNAALWPSLQYDAYGNLTNLTNGGTWQFATGSLLAAEMPATLIESVFLSNPEEAARLAQDDARLEQIAQAIAIGVTNWMDQH